MVTKLDPLGDGISSVELISHMGSDLTVVDAARVSFSKSSWLEPDGSLRKEDVRIIKYLAEHGHWSPFAHPQISFRIKMPIFIVREWYRHEVGLTRNEVSRRYVTDTPEFWIVNEWRLKHENKKQGSSDETLSEELAKSHSMDFHMAVDYCLRAYENALADGVAPELARTILPFNMYTEFVETGSLFAYARIAKLRDQPDAQKETGNYARAVSAILTGLFPQSWKQLTSS